MMEKTRKKAKKRFEMAWLAILVLVLTLYGGGVLFLSQNAPTLGDVLAGNQKNSSPNLSLLVASLLALSLATMSVAKGYEIFKRNRSIVGGVLPEKRSVASEDSRDKQIEELRKCVEGLQLESTELRSRLKNIREEFKDVDKIEKMLRKSNISLSRECERLKSENEMLMLKINSMKIKPKKRGDGKAKRKTRARVKPKRRKKKSRK
jgi:hypothetical protein